MSPKDEPVDVPLLAGTLRVSNGTVRASRIIRRALGRHSGSNRLSSRFLSLLGLNSNAPKSFRISSVNPAASKFIPSESDLDALAALLDPQLVAAVAELGLLGEDDRVAVDLDDDIVLIGSPEAEPLTSLLFDYQYMPDGRGMTYRGNTVPLVYRWEEEWASAKHASCFQRRANGAIAVRPNWPLVKAYPKRQSIYPTIKGDGFLREDFLIITKVPNFISERAWQRGRSIISVAGLHSIGTRAASLLSRDEVLLGELESRIANLPSGPRWWQIVLAVDEINHDHERGSMPIRIRIQDVVALSLTDEELISARKVVNEKLREPQVGMATTSEAARINRRLGFEVNPPFTAENLELLHATGSGEQASSSGDSVLTSNPVEGSFANRINGRGLSMNTRSVFIVHGRNLAAKAELVKFLRHLDARPMSWEQAAEATKKTRPYTLDIVNAGMKMAQCIIVLFTPDDEARLKHRFLNLVDGPHEKELTGQPRQNVILEAGMAMAIAPSRTIFVRMGRLRDMSDISGINWIDLDDTWDNRKRLVNELISAGVEIHADGNLVAAEAGKFEGIDI